MPVTTRSTTALLWLLGGILLTLEPALPAGASCNAIPAGAVRFRGWRGTVDRPFVRAGDSLTLRPACGSDALPPAVNARVTIVAKSPVGGSVLIEHPKDVPGGLTFKVPRMEFAGPAGPVEFAGPVAIAVTAAVDPPPLSDLAGKSCRAFNRRDVFVCIDELFASDGTPCSYEIQPVIAAVTALPTKNEFKKLCTRDDKLDPLCDWPPAPSRKVTYTLDTSGNVLLNMSWGSILKDKPNSDGQKDRRYVQGAVLATFLDGVSSPIDVPSAAFLDSFNAEGVSFDPKPLFLPGVVPEPTATPGQTAMPGAPLTATPREVALYGTADRDESVLRIARRKLWKYACDGGPHTGQACEPHPVDQPDRQDCPAAVPPSGPPPTCKEQPSASYFACVNGERTMRPCTRPHHCPGGQCTKLSELYCGGLSAGPTAKPCTKDSDCDLGHGCGPSLFNLSGKLNNGIGTFPRDTYRAEARHYH